MLFVILFLSELLILYFLSRLLVKRLYKSLYRLTRSKKVATYLFAFLFLPGTIVHELSHLLAAFVLLVPVGKFELMPQEIEGKLKLGSVSIGKTDPIRKLIIGAAPFLIGTLLILSLLYFTSHNNLLGDWRLVLLIGYSVFEIGNTMFSSKRDLEGAWKIIVILLSVYVMLYFLGFRLTIDSQAFLSNEFIGLLKQASIYLLVPIVIDLAMIGILRK